MKIKFLQTLKSYDKANLPNDILAGLVIAAVSIPISMGYSQIAGLPAVYGLYGSVFPIIAFAILSSSPQFIFGVDAAPAALIGSALVTLGIESGSSEAMSAVPMLTFFVALWLAVFYFAKAGRLVKYISLPVMGGFITGICSTIILMQIPKLMGGSSGVGELFELAEHILHEAGAANLPSLCLGVVSITLILIAKKLRPKMPFAAILMFAGVLMTIFLPLKEWGVATLADVSTGLPAWSIPDFGAVPIKSALGISLPVAGVIMAETLLAENNFAQKNAYRIDDNGEILAFSVGNLLASLTGCCPVNGSVSRTAMAEQYQSKTQLAGLVAGFTMTLVLLFATGFIRYLPVPILTAIVICALIGATEFHLAVKLWRLNKLEFLIFLGAFLGVLVFGTIDGVAIGVILSFGEMILRTSKPIRSFLGYHPDYREFRELGSDDKVKQIEGVVIYKFSSSLFFGNCQVMQSDIESSIEEDTIAVIVDAGGITSIDVTAAERIESIYHNLKARGIRFYLTEHISGLNAQLRKLELGYMIEEGAVRQTITNALRDIGYKRPYPLKGSYSRKLVTARRRDLDSKMQEFRWAFGDDADQFIEKQINLQIEQLRETGNVDKLFHGNWHYKEEFDEDEWLEHLEEHLKEIVRISGKDEETLADALEAHRNRVHETIKERHPELAERFAERRKALDEHLKNVRPEVYELIKHRRGHRD